MRRIIGRWAPPGENDTGAYVGVVARRMGVGADDLVDLHRHDQLRPMVEAIIGHDTIMHQEDPTRLIIVIILAVLLIVGAWWYERRAAKRAEAQVPGQEH